MQVNPHALGFAPAQRQRGLTDAHDERVTPGASLRHDLDLLTLHEAELEQPPLERGELTVARSHADDESPGTRRQGRKAHESGLEGHASRGDNRIHAKQYE